MPTGIIPNMSLAFTLKWVPAFSLFLVLLFVAFKKYTVGIYHPQEQAIAIALVTLAIVFYLSMGLIWLVRKVVPIDGWGLNGLPYIAGILTALMTLVLPSGSLFNFKFGDLLRFPAMTVLLLPDRIVSSPGERGYRARLVERKRIAEILRNETDAVVAVLKEKPLKLIDMTPGTSEISLVATAIENDKLDIAKHWIERGAKIDDESHVLAAAAAKGDVDVIRYLLQLKAGPVVGRPYNYRTLPIWQASRAGKSEASNLLIEASKALDPSYVDYLFLISVQSCVPRLAHEALRHGANHKSVTEFGPHFLYSVARYCHTSETAPSFEDFVRLAQKLEIDFKASDQYGQTISQYLSNSDSWKFEVFRRLGLAK
ncbi:MAG: hypothetical protein J0L82_12045 [Deltaproteobacteria bacterium]|jgi:hypothetical protein|nr:hypothetical protein [Deltaproteobacteria bacterium]